MLAEFLTTLRGIVEETRRPSILEHPHHRRSILIAAPDGSLSEKPRDKSAIQVFPKTILGLTTLVSESFGAEFAGTVFVCEDSIHAGLKDPEGLTDRSFAHLRLTKTDHFTELERLESEPKWGSPVDIVRYLRQNFLGAGPEALIAALRNVEFNRRNDGTISTEHGRETLGRAVEARVSASSYIPETHTFQVVVFEMQDLYLSRPIKIGIHIDAGTERIGLFLLPGEMERAMEGALTHAAQVTSDQLADRDVSASVVLGTNALQEAIDNERDSIPSGFVGIRSIEGAPTRPEPPTRDPRRR